MIAQQENVSALHGTMINLIAQQENASTLYETIVIFGKRNRNMRACLWNNDIFDTATGKCKHSSLKNDNFLKAQHENVRALHGTMIILIAQQENASAFL